MTRLAASHVVTPHGVLEPGLVEIRDGRVTSVVPTTGPAPDRVLVPGLVDLQVNGVGDIDVASAEGSDWDRLDAAIAAQGTTTWLPTLITAPLASYADPLSRIERARQRPGDRPLVAGVHLEGPFLGTRPGAHTGVESGPIDRAWLDALPPSVRLVTLGADREGAADATRALTDRGVVVAVGHGEPSAAEVDAVVAAGARLVTHAFNAMEPLRARGGGLAPAMLTDDHLTVSVIADGVHVDPAVLDVVFRCKPSGRVVLVTDSVAVGPHGLGAGPVEVRDGAGRRRDGTLAGATTPLDAALGLVVHRVGVSLVEAVRAASTTPAALLGLHDRGALAPGRRADLAALDPITLRCTATWVGGVQVHG